MKTLRVLILAALATMVFGVGPAQANDCSNPKQPCGGCHINPNFSTQDPRPIVCYPV